MNALEEHIAAFQPISLEEMDNVKLQDRTDTKFVLGSLELLEVMEEMLPHYRLLQVDGTRGTHYRTLYFDTADFKHFREHHNGRSFRHKVRFREYVGSDLAFLEVKRKTGTGRTDKARMPVQEIPLAFTPEQQEFVTRSSGQEEVLLPSLWNNFTRYTFVHNTRAERLTIDLDLRFAADDLERPLGPVVVAELKQERADRSSPFAAIMRRRNLRPASMSKYCVGMLLMDRPVKHNAFKEVLLKLERIREAA